VGLEIYNQMILGATTSVTNKLEIERLLLHSKKSVSPSGKTMMIHCCDAVEYPQKETDHRS
jgi:hypothetical protein